MPDKDTDKACGRGVAEKPAVVKTQPAVRKETDNRRYICGCSLCICGGAVEYPGDVCSICTKYH